MCVWKRKVIAFLLKYYVFSCTDCTNTDSRSSVVIFCLLLFIYYNNIHYLQLMMFIIDRDVEKEVEIWSLMDFLRLH